MGHANGVAAYAGRVHYLVRSIGNFGIWLIGRLQHGDSARLSRGVDQRLAHHEMLELGYSDQEIDKNLKFILLVVLYTLSFPLKLILAFFMNIHRMKNPGSVIKSRAMGFFAK